MTEASQALAERFGPEHHGPLTIAAEMAFETAESERVRRHEEALAQAPLTLISGLRAMFGDSCAALTRLVSGDVRIEGSTPFVDVETFRFSLDEGRVWAAWRCECGGEGTPHVISDLEELGVIVKSFRFHRSLCTGER